jgi:hypothetical protein
VRAGETHRPEQDRRDRQRRRERLVGRANRERKRCLHQITRPEIGELCAAEALTAESGRLRWKRIESRPNHPWDAATLATRGRQSRVSPP